MDDQERTNILLAEGDTKSRLALREYLQAQPGLDVVAQAADSQSLLEQTEARCPDLVLLERDLPGLPIADLIAALRDLNRQLLVVVTGIRPDLSSPAIIAGANAYAYKGEGPKKVLTTIRWVVSEARYVQPPDRFDV